MTATAFLAGGAALAVVVVAVVIATMASWIRAAEQGRGDARVDAQKKAGELAIAAADVETWKQKAAAEKRRADAFDKELDQVAADGDVAGARARVERMWEREDAARDGADAADRDGAGTVHLEPAAPPEPPALDRDALLPPT